MKKLKLFIIGLFSMLLLTACGSTNEACAASIEVESITTNEPVLSLVEDQARVLRYTIRPYNATNKTVRIDTSNLGNIATVKVDEDNDIVVYAEHPGTGVVSLVTNNNKFVSYSITITEKEYNPIYPEPLVYEVDDIVEYFNDKSEEKVGFCIEENYIGWYLVHDFGYADNDSREFLDNATDYYLPFLPIYYRTTGNGYLFWNTCLYTVATSVRPAIYTVVYTTSNMLAAVSLSSHIEDEHLFVEVLIYDYNTNDGLIIQD